MEPLSLFAQAAMIIGTLVICWYGAKVAITMLRATRLAYSFYRWSVAGIKSEKRKHAWYRKFYIIVMWFQFLSWERGMQSITTSYGGFRWWNDKFYTAKTFIKETPDKKG